MPNKRKQIITRSCAAFLLVAVTLLIGFFVQWSTAERAVPGDRTPPAAEEMLPILPEESVPIAEEPAAQPPEPEEETPQFPPTEDWMILLVNCWNPLPADFSVELAGVERGYEMDARAVEPLRRMLADCRAAGLHPMICSAYRTQEYQVDLFNKQVRKQKWSGLSGDAAIAAAAEVVALPGTSEHQIGLAVDLCSENYQLLDEAQEQTPEFQWLREHCAEYGFILRYPPGTTELTGIIYEPWHFRYVGEAAAHAIMDAGITLEEYLNQKDRL